MKAIIVDVLVAVAVASVWVSALGFARLTSAFDRLHCVTFATIGCGFPFILAALVTEGLSTRSLKLCVLLAIALVAGAAVNQAVGRALFMRDQSGHPR